MEIHSMLVDSVEQYARLFDTMKIVRRYPAGGPVTEKDQLTAIDCLLEGCHPDSVLDRLNQIQYGGPKAKRVARASLRKPDRLPKIKKVG